MKYSDVTLKFCLLLTKAQYLSLNVSRTPLLIVPMQFLEKIHHQFCGKSRVWSTSSICWNHLCHYSTLQHLMFLRVRAKGKLLLEILCLMFTYCKFMQILVSHLFGTLSYRIFSDVAEDVTVSVDGQSFLLHKVYASFQQLYFLPACLYFLFPFLAEYF